MTTPTKKLPKQRLNLVLSIILLTWMFPVAAQNPLVKGRVVDFNANQPLAEVQIQIVGSSFSTETDAKGEFSSGEKVLPFGGHVLLVSKEGYQTKRIKIVLSASKTINLDPLLLEIDLTEVEAQIGIISLSDQELQQDEGTAYTVSGLLQSSRDVFLNAAAYDFSTTFFRPRGLDNANGMVLINGVEMNKQFNGRPQWGNWGGLNDAQRNREFAMGLSPLGVSFGGLAGTTNIVMRASQYRKGGRISYAMANRSYEGRIMASYNSGLSKTGWAYSVLTSRRFGQEGFQEGTTYEANSFFVSVEKKLNTKQSINFSAFYTPNRRGRSTAVTKEVVALKGERYNPNWGFQNESIRNSRIREIKEPILLLNYYAALGKKTQLNFNLGYQFGSIGNTRIDAGGTRLEVFNGQEAYLGGARNPFGNYYQNLPSYFLRNENPTAADFQNAFLAHREFQHDGQLDWKSLYEANKLSASTGGNSIYVLQEDRTDDTQIMANVLVESFLSENIKLNSGVRFRNLISENYALVKDLLGGSGYLDVDYFAEGNENSVLGDVAQSNLITRNRIATEGERYKYNYEFTANRLAAFAQLQFKFKHVDFYAAAKIGQTSYQRNGLYENGNFPGARSFGKSETLSYTALRVKGGATYKITGRHLINFNASFGTKAPTLQQSFTNPRQNNDTTFGLKGPSVLAADLSYVYRSPLVKGRLTGFYRNVKNETDIGYYFSENLTGIGLRKSAFVQEVVTDIETVHLGGEFGAEIQLTPTFKVKAAASYAQHVYANNPTLYLTSDDFENRLDFGDGTTKLYQYHVAGGPEQAYQIGVEYRDPEFWWVGTTINYFTDAYIDINNLARTANFYQDFDGQLFTDFDVEKAKQLLVQEMFPAYFLVNVVGGKSWRIKKYFVGFFASINNVLDQKYITGGFEQGRYANYRDLKEDRERPYGQLFGPRYFFGNGTTYYVNAYVRF